MAQHLINVDVKLRSNARQFIGEIRRELKALDAAAKAPGAAMSTRAATGKIGSVQGKGVAKLVRAGAAGQITEEQFKKQMNYLDKQAERSRKRMSKALGAEVPAPTAKVVAKSAVAAYKKAGGDPAKVAGLESQIISTLTAQAAANAQSAKSAKNTAKSERRREKASAKAANAAEADAADTPTTKKGKGKGPKPPKPPPTTPGTSLVPYDPSVALAETRAFKARKKAFGLQEQQDRRWTNMSQKALRGPGQREYVQATHEPIRSMPVKWQDQQAQWAREDQQRQNFWRPHGQQQGARVGQEYQRPLTWQERGYLKFGRMKDRLGVDNEYQKFRQASPKFQELDAMNRVYKKMNTISTQGLANERWAGSQAAKEGTWWQRQQAKNTQTQGGPIRSPLEFQTGKQWAKGRLQSSAGFMASGALLYGGMKLGGDILDEAGDLQIQLALVEAAFIETGETADGITFEGYKEALRGLSRDSGVAISEVAMITRQLSGAFADDKTGTPNFDKALEEADIALRFSKLTGLPQQEITDSLTAISLAFDTNFESIADTTTFLSRSFGVVETDIVRFTADLAPLGAELGFTAEQLAGLGAVAQQASGKTGTVLAEQFGRILPALQSKRAELIKLFNEDPKTAGQIPAMTKAFASGDIDQVLKILIEQYDNLNAAQQNTLAGLVGGRREAAAFYAILDRGDATLRALGTDSDSGKGEFERRWTGYSKTVQFAMTQLRRNVEDFGIALFQSGVDDGLRSVIDLLGGFAKAATTVFKILGAINDALGGLPAKLLAAAAAFKVLSMASAATGGFGLSALGAGLGMGGRTLDRLGSGKRGALFNPYMPDFRDDQGVLQKGGLKPSVARFAGSGSGFKVPFTQKRFGLATGFTTQPNQQYPLTGDPEIVQGRGTTASAALGAVAPMLATMLTGYALERINSYKEQIKADVDRIEEQVTAQLEKGVSPEEIRRRIGPTTTDETLGTKVVSRLLTQQESAGEQYARATTDAIQKAEAPKIGAQLNALLEETPRKGDDDVFNKFATRAYKKTLADAGKADKKKGIRKFLPFARGVSAMEVVPKDLDKFKEDQKKVIQAYIDDPAKDSNRKAVDALLKSVEGDPELEAILEEAIAQYDRSVREQKEDVKHQEAAAEYRLSAQEAATKFGLGEIGMGGLMEALQREADSLQLVLNDLVPGSEQYLTAINEIREQEARTHDLFMADLEQRYETNAQVAGIGSGGETSVEEDLLAASQKFRDVNAEGSRATVKDRSDKAFELINARDAKFQKDIDEAANPVEALRIFRQGPGDIDKDAVRAINRQKMSEGKASTFAQGLGEGLKLGEGDDAIAAARDYVIDAIEKFGEFADEEIIKVLKARRDIAAANAKEYHERGENNQYFVDQVANYDRLIGEAEGVTTDTDFVDPKTGMTPEEQRKEDARLAKDAATYTRQQGKSALDAKYALLRSTVTDPVRRAELEVAELEAEKAYDDPDDPNDMILLQARINEARQSLADTIKDQAKALGDARSALERTRAKGDPIKLALISIADAARARRDAAGGTEAEKVAAQDQTEQAAEEYKQAQEDKVTAQKRYYITKSTAEGDSVGAALQEKLLADDAVRQAADGSAEKWNALADQVNANKAYRDSLTNAFAAQHDLAAALFESVGDVVAVAQEQLNIANANYYSAVANGQTGPELDALHAAAVRAQTALTDTKRQDKLGDLEYLYEFDKVTVTQYINSLKDMLKAIPESDKENRYEIERKIKALREELSKDLEFNLPSDLRLPTLYEARRLGQNPGGSYQDNRVLTFTIVANNSVDADAAMDKMVEAFNGPARVGPAPRMY